MTLVLAGGVWRMSRRAALVKKLQAVEALGQVQVIAVDKTGTITKNEIMLQSIFIDGKIYNANGSGYEPKGDVFLNTSKSDPLNHEELVLAGKIAAFGTNNYALFDKHKNEWQVTGDPTEAALSVFAQKVGYHKNVLEKESPKLGEIAFDYRNKFRAALHRVTGVNLCTVTGAPETVLGLSTKIWHKGKSLPLSAKKKEELEAVLLNLFQDGLRVLAFAYKENDSETLKSSDVRQLTFAGFFGLIDALRPEVHKAVEKANLAGIKVVMITGDHKITAQAIAREAGIYHEGDTVLTGEELDSFTEAELIKKLDSVTIFARVTPEHKLTIIKAYKKRGITIAMTGDGVNDAPSLTAAD